MKGFLGIQPYTANLQNKQRSFLWRLKEDGVIEHLVIAFYVRQGGGNKSFIKFGSHDPSGMMPGLFSSGKLMQMIKTKNSKTWHLDAKSFKVGGSTF